MVDRDMRILWANEAVTTKFGFDVVGKKCYGVLFDRSSICVDGECPAEMAFNDMLSHSFEVDVKVLGGESKVFECTSNVAIRGADGAPSAVIEVCKDITEYKRTEQALVQNAKLASLGELGAGIAHELNSPLAGILSLAELMLGRMDSKDPNYIFVEKIKDACVRSKHIIMDLMSYSRPGTEKWRPLSVNDALRSVISLFVSELKSSDVKIIEDFTPDLSRVMGNKGQLMEVFLNIIKNAKDVVDGNGVIVIKTSSAERAGGEMIVVEFTDNGPGIPEDVIGRIFDPFFTTKEKGGGMNIGLGLSISKGIIEAHAGRIEVENVPQRGAKFRVLFPSVVGEGVGDNAKEVENG